ncbi:unnamed protein product [Cladocopium goreaui]|uniref:AP-3 complex subunit delta-1 n=1 Tax=Cladocopium goreaui TaxID=2562237 RepID=A0A9P1CE95_9DINO|nr:unnamed protein product [Cladocopium goreaui]
MAVQVQGTEQKHPSVSELKLSPASDAESIQARVLELLINGLIPWIADVALQFSQVQVESSVCGRIVLCSGPLQQRSAKVKANLDSSPFVAPVVFDLRCELEYTVKNDGGEAEAQKVPVELRLPATTFLVPQALGEDAMSDYISENPELLSHQTSQAVSFEKSVSDLPMLVGRCAGLCHFHGIQQASGQDMKFILVAATLPATATPLEGQSAAPSNALVICRCAALVRGSTLEMRVTVKAYQKDVADEICSQLVTTFRELIEGRLA